MNTNKNLKKGAAHAGHFLHKRPENMMDSGFRRNDAEGLLQEAHEVERFSMALYPAVLSKEPGSDYGVDFPDFPGCVTAGRSPQEAKLLAEEALAFHIEGMREDGMPLPEPTSIDLVPGADFVIEIFFVDAPETTFDRPSRCACVNEALVGASGVPAG